MTVLRSVHVKENMETIKNILEEDGCVVITSVLNKEEIQCLESDLDQYFSSTNYCHGDFYGYATKRLSGLVAKSSVCQTMSINPLILSIMDEFLLRGCREYQLNLTQAISIGPGEPEQIIHPDDPMFPFEHTGYEAMINCMWAVDDFRVENGATHVVPGSHKWPRDRRPEPHEIVHAVMPSGSVLIYFGSLLHAGGANKTAHFRTGVVISYCLGWLKQAENSYLAVPLDIASGLPERLQRLLGYFVHKPNLGCVEGQDPILLLREGAVNKANFEEFLPDEVKPILKEHRSRVLNAA